MNLPKYARVNCIKLSVEEAVSKLTSEGYCIVSRSDFIEIHSLCIGGKHPELLRHHASPQEQQTCMHKSFCQDSDIENLLMFCPFAMITSSSTYASSQLTLQDKVRIFVIILRVSLFVLQVKHNASDGYWIHISPSVVLTRFYKPEFD